MDPKSTEDKKKKRKRKHDRTKTRESKSENSTGTTTATTSSSAADGTKRRKRKSNPLNGLILAISTLENKSPDPDPDSNTGSTSYKEVCSLCETLGASTTAQVHKRVFAVICNKSAILQSTQRVRKALKKYIIIIDVEWLFKCQQEGMRVDHEDYLLTDLAKEVVAKRKLVEDNRNKDAVDVQDESDEELLNTNVGWSEPVSLDCCCVCHDDDRDDCKWCCGEEKCNIILKKLANAEATE